jgi:hypothetical protein
LFCASRSCIEAGAGGDVVVNLAVTVVIKAIAALKLRDNSIFTLIGPTPFGVAGLDTRRAGALAGKEVLCEIGGTSGEAGITEAIERLFRLIALVVDIPIAIIVEAVAGGEFFRGRKAKRI